MKPTQLAFPRNLFLSSSVMMAAFFPLSASAATFTWDGGDTASNSWTAANNWDPDGAPTLDNTSDVVFNTLTRPSGFISSNTILRSLAFGANVDGALAVRLMGFPTGPQVARTLTLDTDAVAGNATITVDADASGDITIGNITGDTASLTGTTILADNLVVNHSGSGLLLFNRGIAGTGFGITKNGAGRMQTNSFNTFTGPVNLNGGTLIANTFGSNGEDLNAASAINLGGGTLEIGASSGTNKTYATVPLNVSAPSTLTYRNVNAGTFTAQFTGVGAFALNANLSVKNTSTTTSVVNAFNIGRAITGSGNLLVETYNNIASNASDFSLGRLLISGSNSGVTGWNGNLVISKGTVSLGGNAVNAAGNGGITIGTTADTFGAGMTFFPTGTGGTTVSYANAITVTAGGFRAIKGGGTNHSVTFSGPITLNGDLTLDHTWSTADRRISLNGNISGPGGLTITRAAGSTATTAVMSGTNTYNGATTVANGASLSIARTCSLTSNISVQSGARIGGAGSNTGTLSLAAGSNFFFFFSPTFGPMNVTGSVTVDSSFGVDDLVGGSQGEVVPWANVPDGVYTLIGTTSSTFGSIENFGSANALPVGTGSQLAYFQNGGGTSGGGLQLVVTGGVSGYDAWKSANTTSGTLTDDHDGDGVDNGTEYFMFGNASSTGFTTLPGVVNTAGVLSVTWPKAATTAGYLGVYNVHFFVETSDNLVDWVTAPLGSGAGQVSITGTGGTSVKYTFPAGTKKFARLKVTGP